MIGQRVSHYLLKEKLGSGTYGEVYRGIHAHDPELQVAVKVLHPALKDDANFLESLRNECRRLDRMDHPNIVRFRDLVVEPQLALVLELLVGADLSDHIARKPISIGDAVAVLDSVLDGMAYAHKREVVHRDLKPSNVFLCIDGRVKVLDFGIARAADNTQATKTGQLSGTLDYIAPERFTAGGGGPVADVYSLGLLAWEMLAGRPACPDGDLARKMGWHMGVGADDVRTVRNDVPAWLAEVIAKLTVTDRDARPPDGAAALQLFRRARPTGFEEDQSLTDPRGRATGTNPPGTVTLDVSSLPPVASELPKAAEPTPVVSEPLKQKPAAAAPDPVPVAAPDPVPDPVPVAAPDPVPDLPPPPAEPKKKGRSPIMVGGMIAVGVTAVGGVLLCCGGGAGIALLDGGPEMEGTWKGICQAAYLSHPDYMMPLPIELTIWSQSGTDFSGMMTLEFSMEQINGDVEGWTSGSDFAFMTGKLTYSSETVPMELSGSISDNVLQGDCSVDMSGDMLLGELTLAKIR